jgi:hypothetical protein
MQDEVYAHLNAPSAPSMRDKHFCVRCRELLPRGQFREHGLMCDACCLKVRESPPPCCPLCGMMWMEQADADKCCTRAGW